jgi:parallel beta-helix repeat protein
MSRLSSKKVVQRRRRGLAWARGLVLAVALATLWFVATTAPSGAASRHAPVECGATITHSVVLHRDLTGCPNNGIVIGADNVTLNLNGHTISGDGAFNNDCPRGAICDRGVDNSQGHIGVTVKGGSIRGFAFGVWIEGAQRNTVRDLTITDNAILGILVVESSRVEVSGNRVCRNGVGNDGAGLGLVASDHSRVERNVVDANEGAGLQVIFGSNDNVITRNKVTDSPDSGLSISGNHNQVDRNTVSRNGDDMIVAGDDNIVSRNRATDALGCADDGCGYGISFEHGVGNRFTRNLIIGAEVGIRVDAFESPASDTTIDRNVIRDATKDGIAVNLENTGQEVSGTYLFRNLVIESGDDGIDVESSATRLTRNTTVRNADLGIEAVAGVTDGGHNHATGNGNPAQCTGVVCTP